MIRAPHRADQRRARARPARTARLRRAARARAGCPSWPWSATPTPARRRCSTGSPARDAPPADQLFVDARSRGAGCAWRSGGAAVRAHRHRRLHPEAAARSSWPPSGRRWRSWRRPTCCSTSSTRSHPRRAGAHGGRVSTCSRSSGSRTRPALTVMNKLDRLAESERAAARDPGRGRRRGVGADRRGARRPPGAGSGTRSAPPRSVPRLRVPYERGGVLSRVYAARARAGTRGSSGWHLARRRGSAGAGGPGEALPRLRCGWCRRRSARAPGRRVVEPLSRRQDHEGVVKSGASDGWRRCSSVGLWAGGGRAALRPEGHRDHPGGKSIEEAQQEAYDGPKARIAVSQFKDKTGKGWWTGAIGDGMADMLSTALFHSNRYIVLERQQVSDVLREQDLGGGRPDQEGDRGADRRDRGRGAPDHGRRDRVRGRGVRRRRRHRRHRRDGAGGSSAASPAGSRRRTWRSTCA